MKFLKKYYITFILFIFITFILQTIYLLFLVGIDTTISIYSSSVFRFASRFFTSISFGPDETWFPYVGGRSHFDPVYIVLLHDLSYILPPLITIIFVNKIGNDLSESLKLWFFTLITSTSIYIVLTIFGGFWEPLDLVLPLIIIAGLTNFCFYGVILMLISKKDLRIINYHTKITPELKKQGLDLLLIGFSIIVFHQIFVVLSIIVGDSPIYPITYGLVLGSVFILPAKNYLNTAKHLAFREEIQFSNNKFIIELLEGKIDHELENVIKNLEVITLSKEFWEKLELIEWENDDKNQFILEMTVLSPSRRIEIINEMIRSQ